MSVRARVTSPRSGRSERGERWRVHVKAQALLELVDEDAEVERVGTGFTFTEGPIWNPEGCSCCSATCPATCAGAGSRGRACTEVARPVQQVQRHDARRRRPAGRLRARHELARARATRTARAAGETVSPATTRARSSTAPTTSSSTATARSTSRDPTYGRMPGFGLEREQDLDFQGVYRIAPGGGDPQLARGRLRPAQRPLLLARRVAAVRQRHDARAHPRLRRRRRRHARRTARVFAEGIGSGDLDDGDLVDGMKLDERGNIWVTGPGGVWVFDARRRAPRHDRGARERRQPQLGRPRLERAVHPGDDLDLPHPLQGRRQPTPLHEVTQ